MSSDTGHASLDTILEARSHFAQRFKGNRLNFSKNFEIKIQNFPLSEQTCRDKAQVIVLKTLSFCVKPHLFG